MTPTEFCFWLQGHFELNRDSHWTANQVKVIKDHLKLVMKKKTPTRIVAKRDKASKKAQAKLRKALETMPMPQRRRFDWNSNRGHSCDKHELIC